MDTDLVKYYEDRFSMMTTKGWSDLIQDVEGMLDEYNKITNVSSEAQLHFRKGQVDILSWLIGLKDISEHTYKELTDETIL